MPEIRSISATDWPAAPLEKESSAAGSAAFQCKYPSREEGDASRLTACRPVLPRVAFVCVHNSCRSQIAEALGRHLAAEVFESCSAGTETKPQINPDAVRLVKQLYGIDMEKTQYSKLISELLPVDTVVTMGCNVQCPALPCGHREDWGLDDPTGQPDEVFLRTIREIEKRVLELAARVKNGWEQDKRDVP